MSDAKEYQYTDETEIERPRLKLQKSVAAPREPAEEATLTEKLPSKSAGNPFVAPQAPAVPPPPEPAKLQSTSIDDALQSANNGTASYVELEYTGTFWSNLSTIWLNRFLILISGGILFPWVHARSKEHFYRNVRIDGTAFEMKSNPTRACVMTAVVYLLVAASLAIGFKFSFPYSGWVALGVFGLAALVVPFIFREMARSETNGLSYRGIPFSFTGDVFGAIGVYLLMPLAAFGAVIGIALASNRALGVGSILFWLMALSYARQAYKFKNLGFGKRRIRFSGSFKEMQAIYTLPTICWIAFNLTIVGAGYALVEMGMLTDADVAILINADDTQDISGSPILAIVFLSVAIGESVLIWWTQMFVRIKSEIYYLERIELEGATVLDAYSAWKYFVLRFTNALIRALSFGILEPLVALREHRYYIQNMAIIGGSKTINRICRVAQDDGGRHMN